MNVKGLLHIYSIGKELASTYLKLVATLSTDEGGIVHAKRLIMTYYCFYLRLSHLAFYQERT